MHKKYLLCLYCKKNKIMRNGSVLVTFLEMSQAFTNNFNVNKTQISIMSAGIR